MFVSVIIPTYNRSEKVGMAIDSVLAQTYPHFELIVIDDGSTDNTVETVGKFDDRIRFFRQTNQGVSAARNYGLRQAKGDWIAFLDSDDRWLPDKLAAQVAFFQNHPEATICQTEEIWIRQGKRVNPKKIHRKYSGHIFAQCLPLCIVSPSAVMLQRSIFDRVGNFDENLPACEDYDLWLRIAVDTPIFLIDQPLIVKTGGHPDQLSRKYWGMDRFRVQSIIKLLDDNRLSAHQRVPAIVELHEKCDVLINGFEKRRRFEEAEKYRHIKYHYPRVSE